MFKLKSKVILRDNAAAGANAREIGGSEISARDLGVILKDNLPYAKYIVFGGGETFIAKKATTEAVNADICRGGDLRAEYSAALGADECIGETIDFIGLSADGSALACRADIAPVIKESGKPLSASVSVTLNVSEDSDKVLCGGENPVIKFLLGAASLSDNVCAADGDADFYNEYYSRDFLQDNTHSALLSFGTDGITFETQASAQKNETVVFVGGAPALRTYLHGSGTEMLAASGLLVSGDGCAPLPLGKPEKLVRCSSGSQNFADASIVRVPKKLFEIQNALGFFVGAGAEIKTDELGEFAAIGGKREITFIRGGKSMPEYLFSVPRESGDDFAVCRGGYLLRIGEKTTVFDVSGSGTEYDVSRGESNAATNVGGAVYLARASGGKIERFLLARGEVTALPTVELGGKIGLFRSMSRIGAVSNGACYLFNGYAGVDTDVENFRSPRLESLVSRAGGADKITLGDGVAEFSENGKTVLAAIWEDDEFSIGGEATLFGDFAVGGGKIVFFDRGNRALGFSDGFDVKDVTGACKLGDFFVFLFGDGAVKTYYAESGGAFIYCPSAAAGASLTVGVRCRTDALAGKTTARVKFDVIM